jgi:predicted RNA-binding Zn ribbon-like protein
MKRTLAIAGTVLSLGLFTGGVSAGTVWYMGSLNTHAEAEKQRLAESYEEQSNHMGEVIRRDLKAKVEAEKDRMTQEANDYLTIAVTEEASKRSDVKAGEIESAATKKIEELKRYIDQLVKKE